MLAPSYNAGLREQGGAPMRNCKIFNNTSQLACSIISGAKTCNNITNEHLRSLFRQRKKCYAEHLVDVCSDVLAPAGREKGAWGSCLARRQQQARVPLIKTVLASRPHAPHRSSGVQVFLGSRASVYKRFQAVFSRSGLSYFVT